jgi:hypothetical protein
MCEESKLSMLLDIKTHSRIVLCSLGQQSLNFYMRQHFQYSITSDCKSCCSSQASQIEGTALSDAVKPF